MVDDFEEVDTNWSVVFALYIALWRLLTGPFLERREGERGGMEGGGGSRQMGDEGGEREGGWMGGTVGGRDVRVGRRDGGKEYRERG